MSKSALAIDDRAAKLAGVEDLRSYDHCFLTTEGAEHFGKLFGVEVYTYRHKAEPNEPKGLVLNTGATSAIGISAHELAEQICRRLGLKYREMFGRGSQLRECCDAIEQHFRS